MKSASFRMLVYLISARVRSRNPIRSRRMAVADEGEAVEGTPPAVEAAEVEDGRAEWQVAAGPLLTRAGPPHQEAEQSERGDGA